MQIKVSFLLLPSRKLSDGSSPIYCRISLKGDSSRFSTGLSVDERYWDFSKNQAKSKSPFAEDLNESLLKIKLKLRDIHIKLIRLENDISLKLIMDEYRGINHRGCKFLMEVYKLKLDRMKNLEGRGYSKSSIVKQQQMANAIVSFLRFRDDSYDIPLSRINKGFISDLEAFLRAERGMKLISINKVVQSLKSAVNMALDHQWMTENPFVGHRFKHPKTEVIFLKIEEVKTLEEFHFSQPRLNFVKNLFLFSVYTGLHFSDAMSLTKNNLVIGHDGNLWIEYTRGKTGRLIKIPLFSKAKRLIEVFSLFPQIGEFLIPRFSNQKINSYLKEIGDIAGITTPLTHKVARKTFGSILLFYNTPMAVVSELMGHTSMLITQKHYAKLEIKRLGHAISIIDNLV
jgi:site-specific recombinase XerD